MGKGKPNIANTIRALRFHAGEMTQAQLAEKVGVARQTIVAIEKQKYDPSLSLAFKLARCFDVKIEDIFEEDTHVQN